MPTYRRVKGSPLTHDEADDNISELHARINVLPTESIVDQKIAEASTGQAIPRDDSVAQVAPTVGEWPSPADGDVAVVWLLDGTREIWRYDVSAWTFIRSIEKAVRGDRYLGTFGNFSDLGTDWPAADNHDWIQVSSTGFYNGVQVYKGQRWRCTVDSTPHSTPANWSLIPAEGHGGTVMARFQDNSLFHVASATKASVSMRVDDNMGTVAVLEDTSTTQYQYWSGYIDKRGRDTTVASVTVLKASNRNSLFEFVNVASPAQRMRVAMNPQTGAFDKDEPLINVQSYDLGRAWQFVMEFPHWYTDMGWRLFPVIGPLGTPWANGTGFDAASTGELYVVDLHFKGPFESPESAWTDVVLNTGWTSTQGTYDKLQAKKIAREVLFRGLASGGDPTQWAIQLPSNIELGRQAIYPVSTSHGVMPMGFSLTGRGTFLLPAGITDIDWFSMDGLQIRVK